MTTNPSRFSPDAGFGKTVAAAMQEVATLYTSDGIPWVIGYSGGKDSTAALQLVWLALEKVPRKQRSKPVYVITTDTLVENPIVALWVGKSLEKMSGEAERQGLPLTAHRLTPAPEDTFWVNLIGRDIRRPEPSSGGVRNVSRSCRRPILSARSCRNMAKPFSFWVP